MFEFKPLNHFKFIHLFLIRYDRFKNSEKTDETDASENDGDKDVDSKSEIAEQNGAESSI